jgi:hypothetical protein
MNDQPRKASDLDPKDALDLSERDAILHKGTIVFVEKVEEGFGLLEEGEAMIWAQPEDGEGRGISVR